MTYDRKLHGLLLNSTMNFSFQNINTNCRNLAQEYGRTFLFIDRSSTQSMDEQERESAAYLLDLLL